MNYYQSTQFSSIPLKTKISLGLGAILVLGLLFFFAFTFFLIALLSAVVLFIFNLFQRATGNLGPGQTPPQGQKPYHRPASKNNDDVIDI
ncbi:MAG: hypothetical protein NPINA01_13320 [Nitrospinaceae bacterium]|nr:MAG: hypothetical protein NPINA01_13320 [Nitrospinaceae bacterium]